MARVTLTIEIVTDLSIEEIDKLVENTIMRDSYVLDGEGLLTIEGIPNRGKLHFRGYDLNPTDNNNG